jgi:hypothetical protein
MFNTMTYSCSCVSGRRRLGFRTATRTGPAAATSAFEQPQKLRSIDELPCTLLLISFCARSFSELVLFRRQCELVLSEHLAACLERVLPLILPV